MSIVRLIIDFSFMFMINSIINYLINEFLLLFQKIKNGKKFFQTAPHFSLFITLMKLFFFVRVVEVCGIYQCLFWFFSTTAIYFYYHDENNNFFFF